MSSIIPEWAQECLGRLNINSLREHQKSMLDLLEKKVDFIAILPTGYGKSLSYQVAAFLEEKPGIVIIVMPLLALMRQQSERMTHDGFCVAHVTSMAETQAALRSDKTTHIFTSPENLSSYLIPSLYECARATERVTHVVVDETHCVVKWGYAHKRTAAFRSCYSSIGTVRTAVPNAVMIALTATATQRTVQLVTASLSFSDHNKVLRLSPDKLNLRYSVIKPGDHVTMEEVFGTIINNPNSLMKTLIFCRQYQHLGEIFNLLRRRLEPGVVDIYHSRIPDQQQRRIVKDFCNETKLKIVVCTSSFSMGIDIKDLSLVIHYGVSATIDEFVQETGRAGRGGDQAYSVVISHKHSIKGSIISKESKDYVKSNTCRRRCLDSLMQTDSTPVSPGFLCCDICSQGYACCSCRDNEAPCQHSFEKQCFCVGWCYGIPFTSLSTVLKNACVCRDKGDPIQEAACLNEMKALVVCGSPILPQDVTSLVYTRLVNKIMCSYVYISEPLDIFRLGAYSMSTATKLYQIIDKFFCKIIGESTAIAVSSEDSSAASSDIDEEFDELAF